MGMPDRKSTVIDTDKKTPLLTVKNLHAWYSKKKAVLSDFTLELAEHEVAGLIGLNGAGKTTFLKVLSGLMASYHSDDIRFYSQTVNPRSQEFKRHRYTVFAEDNSFQYFTFREYLSYTASAYKKELTDVTELIQGFHFENHAEQLFKDLSTGNRKKAFLITAFALKPELLLLDEPVNGLDYESTEYLYKKIAGYKKYGTILFSSHILESITLTSDRVLVLENGKIRHTFEQEQIDASRIREALHYEHDIKSFC